jgi:hypothetical protein
MSCRCAFSARCAATVSFRLCERINRSDYQQQGLNDDLQALPVKGDKTVKPKTGQALAPALAKLASLTLSAECDIILDDTLSPLTK